MGILSAAIAAAATAGLERAAEKLPKETREPFERTNHRGEPVTLLEGPVAVLGALAGVAGSRGSGKVKAAALVAGAVSGAVGAYDDLRGTTQAKGFRGHLSALKRGEVTSGAVKILGVGAAGLAAAALLPRKSRGVKAVAGVVADGALIAGTANLTNLLDLRPGRALKAVAALNAPLAVVNGPAGAVVGAAAASAPSDLGERAMLGDAGANALGAMLGAAAAVSLPRPARLALLGGIVALTAASEKVSFTKVIERTPPLRWLDMLGRRPQTPPVAPQPREP